MQYFKFNYIYFKNLSLALSLVDVWLYISQSEKKPRNLLHYSLLLVHVTEKINLSSEYKPTNYIFESSFKIYTGRISKVIIFRHKHS